MEESMACTPVVDCEAQDVQWKLTSKSQPRRKWSEEKKKKKKGEKRREGHSMASKTSTDRKKSGDTTLWKTKRPRWKPSSVVVRHWIVRDAEGGKGEKKRNLKAKKER